MSDTFSPPPAAPAPAALAISVTNLRRAFGNIPAVQDVTFDIPRGQVVGFVGANGAGKTTTMRIMATLDYPTMGQVIVNGFNVVTHPREVRKIIGWVPDSFGTYDNMTVLEYLDFYARAQNFKGKERTDRIEDVVQFTDLGPLADRMINKLSKGQGQRLCLARALLHDPQILIMDEPAAGLDPKARVELKHLIRILADEGKTILISSHILEELGQMCDTLLFIDRGRIVHHGSAEDLRRVTGSATEAVYDLIIADGPEKLLQWALLQPHIKIVEEHKNGARIKIDDPTPEVITGVLKRMLNDGILLTEFRREERKLEDAFIDMIGKLDAARKGA
jgi:ABC-2 type transport system ATP-binding protein